MRMFTLTSRLLALVVVCSALLWPAFYNGQPFFFNDTNMYIQGADAGVQRVTHHSTAWSRPEGTVLPYLHTKGVMTGRSVYYGFLMYLGEITSHLWLTIFLQAGVILATIVLLLRALNLPWWPYTPLVGLGLALGSDVPFFASFLMPDMFAGVAILACAVLAGMHARLRPIDKWLWLCLLTPSLLFHDSCFAISLVILLLALLVNTLRRTWDNLPELGVLSLALLIAFLGQTAFISEVTKVVGQPPIRPPFLSARVIQSGPGRRYLLATCPNNGFTMCRYIKQFPKYGGVFLFGLPSEGGMFTYLPLETREQLSKEQTRLSVASVRYDAPGMIVPLAKLFILQVGYLHLTEFNYQNGYAKYIEQRLPSTYLDAFHRSAAYRGAVPDRFLSNLNYLITIAAVSYLLFVVLRRRRDLGPAPEMLRLIRWTVLGVFINDAICGILSDPFDRFEARVVWVLPLLALLSLLPTLLPKSKLVDSERFEVSAMQAQSFRNVP